MGYDVKQKIDTNAKIAVLMGGPSSEAEISRRSGKNVFKALQNLGYKNAELIEVDENIAATLRTKNIEFVYNAMHGRFGEDGCIQGMLEVMGIPYTGCGVMASSVCMNKEYTKNILKEAGIPLIKSVLIKKGEDYKEKIKELKYPFMLKPVSEGSSIGMYKVNNPEELAECFEKSAKYGQDVMVEEFIQGKGLTVGVLEDGDMMFATEIIEFRTKTEWYDYEAKYTAGMTEFIIPAELSEEMTKKVKQIAVDAFKACDCRGVSRVDFMVADDKAYVLEINTSPGMTDLSDLPAQSNAMGIDYDTLVQIILNGAGLNK
ncbi:d-alanine--D-alanine ligase [Clostridium sp. CAG:306]|jgi:D-ala D-ala ligase N-terminal domain protein|nr:d-alanine--D-alanine ligase [Clostridium sp. CAG:306]DAB23342.1 MAG TPA: D-alanine--D-alanine ligase [Candidatus Gastranaerophilales bacterium HUM_21]